MARAEGDTDGIGDHNLVFPFLLNSLELSGYDLSLMADCVLTRNMKHENQKLISAETPYYGILIKNISQFIRNTCQNLVSVHMSEGIIDHFKIINIDDEKRTFFRAVLL